MGVGAKNRKEIRAEGLRFKVILTKGSEIGLKSDKKDISIR